MTTRSFGQRGVVSLPRPAFPSTTTPPKTIASAERPVVAPGQARDRLDDLLESRSLVDALPLLTFAMILFLFGVYGVEVKAAFDPGRNGEPGVRSLIAFGAASYNLVIGSGEWWRAFLAPLLHANFSHIAGNCFAIAFVGMRLEPMIGRAWFALIFTLGGLGGVAGSLLGNPHALVTVGASGAITGLIGALFVVSFHHRAEVEDQRAMRRTALRFGIPALAPLAFAHLNSGATQQVDYYAHLGGAISGAAIGFALCALWSEHRRRPDFARAAAIASLVALAAAMAACAFAVKGYATGEQKAAQFMPLSQVPANLTATDQQSIDLLARYPKDPRAHIIRGIYLANNKKLSAAEDELRDALTLIGSAPESKALHDYIQGVLALVLKAEGRFGAAGSMAAGPCRAEGEPAIKAMLEKAKLCD